MTRKHRHREQFAWHPIWDKSVEGWTAAQVRKNKWRFDRSEDFDDLMQEARLLFLKLERTYPTVTEMANFFALYKTSLKRHFIDKTRKLRRTITNEEISLDELTETVQFEGAPNCGYLGAILEEMPDELKSVLRGLTTGRVRLKLDRPTTHFHYRENANMRLKRRLGITLENPVEALHGYLRQQLIS